MGKIHHAINGTTHYFDWAIFNSFFYVYQRVYCLVCRWTIIHHIITRNMNHILIVYYQPMVGLPGRVHFPNRPLAGEPRALRCLQGRAAPQWCGHDLGDSPAAEGKQNIHRFLWNQHLEIYIYINLNLNLIYLYMYIYIYMVSHIFSPTSQLQATDLTNCTADHGVATACV